jgi:hypothetical protein
MPRYINDVCVIRDKDGRGNATRMKEVFFLTASTWGVTCSIEQGSGKGGRNNASQASSRPKIALQMLLLTRPDRTGEQRHQTQRPKGSVTTYESLLLALCQRWADCSVVCK